MVYIEKEGLPSDVQKKIISIKKSKTWKNIDPNDTEAIRQFFDDCFPKEDVKRILVHEQHGICAYCMRRIHDETVRIEHFIPLSIDKDKAIDYKNMFGVCDGGVNKRLGKGHILCCDAQKNDRKISINPTNRNQMHKIAYHPNGKIYTKPKDSNMTRDIDKVLQLNGSNNKDGSLRDTTTEIVKGRRDTYERARNVMEKLANKGSCTSKKIDTLINRLQDKEEYDEYIGVMLYYFKKKRDSLLSQGK